MMPPRLVMFMTNSCFLDFLAISEYITAINFEVNSTILQIEICAKNYAPKSQVKNVCDAINLLCSLCIFNVKWMYVFLRLL